MRSDFDKLCMANIILIIFVWKSPAKKQETRSNKNILYYVRKLYSRLYGRNALQGEKEMSKQIPRMAKWDEMIMSR